MRWLLAGWLMALPWFTQATPQVTPVDTLAVGVEMPCHAEMASGADTRVDSECPHCTGDGTGLCKCCSYTATATIPAVEVGAHFLIASSEQLALPETLDPPADHPERLYRPPIRRSI